MIEVNNLNIQYNGISFIKKDHLSIPSNHFIAIEGESGTGKSSFLNFLALKSCFGDLRIDGNDVYKLNDQDRQTYILNSIAYIFQKVEFVSGLNLQEILELSANLTCHSLNSDDIKEIKDLVGLSDLDNKTMPYQLSGGQRQLLAVAEALVKETKIILCDEITSGLDSVAAKGIIRLLKKIAHTKNITIIMVIHQKDYIAEFDDLLEFKDGTIYWQKQTDIQISNKSSRIFTTNKKNNHLLIKAYFKSTKKSKILFLLLMLIAISLSSVGYKYCFQVINHIRNLQSMVESNTYYVVNDTLFEFDGVPMYVTANLHLSAEQMNQISNIEGVESSYPVLAFNQLEGYKLKDEGNVVNEDCFTYKVSNQVESVNLLNKSSSIVLAYKDQQYFDLHCDSNINQMGSIYITQSLANSLNISDLEEGMTLTYTALVPIELNSVDLMVENSPKKAEEPIYKKLTFEYEIRGILNPYFQNLFGSENIYMDYNEMTNILEQHQSSWQPNTYVIKTSGKINNDELKTNLREINSYFNLLDPNENITYTFASILKPTQVTQVIFYIMVAIVCMLGLTYSYMQSKNIRDFMQPLIFRGVSKKTLCQTLFKVLGMETVILVVSSLTITNCLYKIGISLHLLVQASNAHAEWIKVNLIAITLSVLIMILIYGVSIIKCLFGKTYD